MQVCPIDISHLREDASWVIRRFRDATRDTRHATRDIGFDSVPVCSVLRLRTDCEYRIPVLLSRVVFRSVSTVRYLPAH